MENLDWLYKIAPWLKNAQAGGGAGGAPGGGANQLGMLMPWLKNFTGGGGGTPGGGMFGGGGWPFFGNTGQDSGGGAPSTRAPGNAFGGADGGLGSFERAAPPPPAGDRMPQFGGGGGNGFGVAGAGGGPVRHFAEGGRPEEGKPAVVGEEGPEVFVPDKAKAKTTGEYIMGIIRAINKYAEPTQYVKTPGPQSGSVVGDVLGSIPLATGGLKAGGVKLSPIGDNATRLQIGNRFARQPLANHPGRSGYPAVAALQAAGPVQAGLGAQTQLPPGASAPASISPAADVDPTEAPVNMEPRPQAPSPTTGRGQAETVEPAAAPPARPLFMQSGEMAAPPSTSFTAPMPRPRPTAPVPRPQQRRPAPEPENPLMALVRALRLADLGAPATGQRRNANASGHYAEGGRPPEGEAAVVGEEGPEVFVPDQPGTVIPNHAIPPWLHDALIQMPAPAAQPPESRLGRMGSARGAADWRDRDPNAAVQQTGERWEGIRDNPADTMENLGVTGQIIAAAMRNASPNTAQAAPAGGKSAKKDMAQATSEVLEEQKLLAKQGFYEGTPDGVDGNKTKEARRKYREHQVRERELAIQEGQVAAGEKKTATETLKQENETKRLDILSKDNEEKEARRKEGEARFREAEKNLPLWDQLMRAYGPTIGGLLGLGGGALSRYGVKKIGDKYQASQAAKAETALGNPTGAVTKENVAERVGNINDWYRRGGAKNEPFVSTPTKAPGVAVNVDKTGMPIATPVSDLFSHGVKAKVADAGALGTIGGLGYWQMDLPEAKANFEKAKLAVNDDASDVNIEAYQTAKRRLSSAEAKMNATIGALGTYVGSAAAKQRYPITPPTNIAGQEKLSIEAFLREHGTTAEKAARAAATRQANAARKAQEVAAMPPGAAPGPLPANPMRKFDNQGNPINRSESLQDLAEPIRAHVPRRTRKTKE